MILTRVRQRRVSTGVRALVCLRMALRVRVCQSKTGRVCLRMARRERV